MMFELIAQLSVANIGQKNPCAVAVLAAELALQTMKRGT
jgi:hypothetical protein